MAECAKKPSNKNQVKMGWSDAYIASTLVYQEMITIPDPGNSNRFYLFTCGVTSTSIPGFYYSIIDLSYNNGLGRVVQKNIQLHTFPVSDGLAAVKHGNGRDWWVVFKRWDILNNDFYFYLVTPTGLNGPYVQSIGSATTNNITRMKFTKDGSKLFIVNPVDLIECYDFDRCTGQLSNLSTIQQQGSAGPYCDFQPFSFYLGGHRTYVGLPNNPNYELGPDTNSICDTVLAIQNLSHESLRPELNVWYNPNWQFAFINAQHLNGKRFNLQVFDLLGKLIFTEEGSLDSVFFTKNFNCSRYSHGTYLILLQTEKEVLSKKLILN